MSIYNINKDIVLPLLLFQIDFLGKGGGTQLREDRPGRRGAGAG